ncbi:CPXCG motif-containing cysteine-rich protein [Marivirga arenosa]|uniref:CPXCG motif-containing cysteine-rich protein n=1 Tax=Marivirga arenosa TaxID=3059076 RepID=A0AA49JDN9_9BACT|nr:MULTISPECIES: CPXCG motif-containing cysteine-rich protein [unclassified Marivirga]WKK83025.1 CPXCG motif-containing cysteine-rich protein [Marivirga sp. BKB1-2]WKK86262.1 CPXCG motif-containing cysteine-rich protein [Marivirga sp. ABR2-2]
MIEQFFQCPHCFQEISMLVDSSISKQSYVEDCEVCCNPLQINLEIEDGEISYFEASPAQ